MPKVGTFTTVRDYSSAGASRTLSTHTHAIKEIPSSHVLDGNSKSEAPVDGDADAFAKALDPSPGLSARFDPAPFAERE